MRTPTPQIVEQAKEVSTEAVARAASGDFETSVARDGSIQVRDVERETEHRIGLSLLGVDLVRSGRDGSQAPGAARAVAMSRLLNDPVTLFKALKRGTDYPSHVPVESESAKVDFRCYAVGADGEYVETAQNPLRCEETKRRKASALIPA